MLPNPQEQSEARLLAYLEGELDAAGRAEIERHLAAHPNHRQLIEDLSGGRELLRQLPRQAAPPALLNNIQHQLERSVLLDRQRDAAECIEARMQADRMKIGRWDQFRAVAAVLLVASGIAAAVYYALPPLQPRNPVVLAPDGPSDGKAKEGETRSTLGEGGGSGISATAEADLGSTFDKLDAESTRRDKAGNRDSAVALHNRSEKAVQPEPDDRGPNGRSAREIAMKPAGSVVGEALSLENERRLRARGAQHAEPMVEVARNASRMPVVQEQVRRNVEEQAAGRSDLAVTPADRQRQPAPADPANRVADANQNFANQNPVVYIVVEASDPNVARAELAKQFVSNGVHDWGRISPEIVTAQLNDNKARDAEARKRMALAPPTPEATAPAEPAAPAAPAPGAGSAGEPGPFRAPGVAGGAPPAPAEVPGTADKRANDQPGYERKDVRGAGSPASPARPAAPPPPPVVQPPAPPALPAPARPDAPADAIVRSSPASRPAALSANGEQGQRAEQPPRTNAYDESARIDGVYLAQRVSRGQLRAIVNNLHQPAESRWAAAFEEEAEEFKQQQAGIAEQPQPTDTAKPIAGTPEFRQPGAGAGGVGRAGGAETQPGQTGFAGQRGDPPDKHRLPSAAAARGGAGGSAGGGGREFHGGAAATPPPSAPAPGQPANPAPAEPAPAPPAVAMADQPPASGPTAAPRGRPATSMSRATRPSDALDEGSHANAPTTRPATDQDELSVVFVLKRYSAPTAVAAPANAAAGQVGPVTRPVAGPAAEPVPAGPSK